METEKKKSSDKPPVREENEIPLPSRSEIIRQTGEKIKDDDGRLDNITGKHTPVVERPSRTFSIKDVITDTERPAGNKVQPDSNRVTGTDDGIKEEFNEDTFAIAWKDFQESIRNEGPRIVSMFKSIRPRLEDDHTIIIPLTNAAQKDIFTDNYRQRMLEWFKGRFLVQDFDIETSIDLSETNEVPYTDEQKFSYLQEKYPVMKDFKKTFNLDFT